MLAAEFNLPAFGAKVTMPRTPTSMINLERHELPESVKEDMLDFAISPVTKARFMACLEIGMFTEAYDIWNKAAERHLALRLKILIRPAKYAGQTLAALGTHRVEAGAATEWRQG